jgi:pimeloyl-ACP methyl ester carboxylesterase
VAAGAGQVSGRRDKTARPPRNRRAEMWARSKEWLSAPGGAVVGHSWGTLVALSLALDQPADVRVTRLLKVADAIEGERLEFAERLRAEALKLGTTQAQPGSANRYLGIGPLVDELSESWRGLDSPVRATIKAADDLVGELGKILDRIRVLFVSCSPSDEARLRVDTEHRTIIEAINSGPNENVIEMKVLPAATIEDLRRALLELGAREVGQGSLEKRCLYCERPAFRISLSATISN